MILEVFIIFISICFVLIFLAFYTQIKLLALIGFTGLFLLGIILSSGNLYVPESYTQINHPACSECAGNRTPIYRNTTTTIDNYTYVNVTNPDNRTENITIIVNNPYNVTTTEFVGYTNIEGTGDFTYIASTDTIINYRALKDGTSKWFGIWLSIMSALAFILVIISNKK